MLVVLRRELYEGYSSGGVAAVSTDGQPELATKRHAGWQAMLKDLSNRLEGRPYIFKLANRIRDDIARIEKLRAFEEEYNVDLADFVESPASGRKPLR